MLLSKLKGVFGVEFKLCKGDRKLPKVTAHQNWPELLKIQLPGYYCKTGQIRASGSRGKDIVGKEQLCKTAFRNNTIEAER